MELAMTNHAESPNHKHQYVGSSEKKLKQAVVVIHGMGEQRPMDTIRDFVNNVWKQNPDLKEPHFWNKPSTVCESFEQRRLTTDSPEIKNSGNRVNRTDFYEYYWAHHTVGTKWEHFVGWFLALLRCSPHKYKNHPKSLRPLWYMLWGVFILVGASIVGWMIAVYYLTDYYKSHAIAASFLGVVISAAEAAVLFFSNKLRKFFTDYFGDVARYVRADPANIAIRQAIRKGGIELLERIHQTGEYDRVVLVGHSLGSIVAYDILNHLWARHYKFKNTVNGALTSTPLSHEAIKIIDKLQAMVAESPERTFDKQKYWELQRSLFNELTCNDTANNWLISDFVTLGSPLTYADILLFDKEEQFIKRKLDREYPTSPPLSDHGKWYFGSDSDCYLHHGAVFAAVKWTNFYTPHKYFVKGDLISGSVSRNFSYRSFNNKKGEMIPPSDLTKSPIEEIELDWKNIKDGFTHTDYWSPSTRSDFHLVKLREAIALYPPINNKSQENADG